MGVAHSDPVVNKRSAAMNSAGKLKNKVAFAYLYKISLVLVENDLVCLLQVAKENDVVMLRTHLSSKFVRYVMGLYSSMCTSENMTKSN